MKIITTILFIVGIGGFVLGGYIGDLLPKKRGLKFGRRFIGIAGLSCCGMLIALAAYITQPIICAVSLIGANACFAFSVMVSYAVCADIGRNNAGTVTGAMNFFGQIGGLVVSLFFGKIADAMHNFNYPLYLVAAVSVAGALLWLTIDPTRQLKN